MIINETKPLFREVVIIFIVAFIFNIAALGNDFTYDDIEFVVQNSKIREIPNLLSLLTENTAPLTSYRPLTLLSYAIEYNFFKLNPVYYHFNNLLLHTLVCIVLYLFLNVVLERNKAFLVSLLFSVLPIHSEVVGSVFGRSELLSALFILLTLLSFVSISKKNFSNLILYLFSFFFSLSACLSKESGVHVLPLLILIFYFFNSKDFLKVQIVFLITAFLSIFTFLLLRGIALESFFSVGFERPFIDNPLVSFTPFYRAINGIYLQFKYFYLCIIPQSLSADYSFDHLSLIENIYDYRALLILFVMPFAVYLLAKKPKSEVSFYILWFIFSFAVTSNIFLATGTIFGERLAYLPSVAVVGFIAYLLQKKISPSRQKYYFIFLLASYAIFNLFHLRVWQNNQNLFSYQIEVSPESVRTLNNYGISLLEKGEEKQAEKYLLEAFLKAPEYATPANSIAKIYANKGRFNIAIYYLNKALEKSPSHIPTLDTLARIKLHQGQIVESAKLYRRINAVAPFSFEANWGLLNISLIENNLIKAKSHFEFLRANYPENKEFLANVVEISKKIDQLP